jgi:hypothetical protein
MLGCWLLIALCWSSLNAEFAQQSSGSLSTLYLQLDQQSVAPLVAQRWLGLLQSLPTYRVVSLPCNQSFTKSFDSGTYFLSLLFSSSLGWFVCYLACILVLSLQYSILDVFVSLGNCALSKLLILASELRELGSEGFIVRSTKLAAKNNSMLFAVNGNPVAPDVFNLKRTSD